MKPETPELIEVSSDSDSNDGHVDDDEDDQPDNRSVELLTLARLRGSSASVAESQPTKKSKGVAGKKPNGPPTGTLPRAKAAAEGSSSEQKKARKRSAKNETGLTKEPKLNGSTRPEPGTTAPEPGPVGPEPEVKVAGPESNNDGLMNAVDNFMAGCRSMMTSSTEGLSIITANNLAFIEKRFNSKIAKIVDPSDRKELESLFNEHEPQIRVNNLYLIIQKVLAEIENRRSKPGSQPPAPTVQDPSVGGAEATDGVNDEESSKASTSRSMSSEDLRRQENISKLEKALHLCQIEITRLEGKELDLDDLENSESDYLKLDRYRTRFMEIFRKLAQLRREESTLGRQVEKKFKMVVGTNSDIPGDMVDNIQKFVNRMIKSERFTLPSFHEIFEVCVDVNRDKNLGFSEARVQSFAENAFKAVGKELKQRRFSDVYGSLLSYIPEATETEDPADKNPELSRKLDDIKADCLEKKKQVFADFEGLTEDVADGGSSTVTDDDEDS